MSSGQGFQPVNIDAVRSDRVVCVINNGEIRVKVFQILFGKDGSLFITFPYLKNRTGILSSAVIPATGTTTSQVNLQRGGKVTSHLVKYSHHPDGRAHFSQDGKIFTAIKRQSIPLDKQHGHLFSLLIQGLDALSPVNPLKDVSKSAAKKVLLDFPVKPSPAFKFVGRWFNVDGLRCSEPTDSIGPIVPTRDEDGLFRAACMVASPYANPRHVLLLTCYPIPSLGSEPECFCFYGGFDPKVAMADPHKEAGFLAFNYPITDADEVRARIGSVDFTPVESSGS